MYINVSYSVCNLVIEPNFRRVVFNGIQFEFPVVLLR